ncbi:glycosyltransferase [Lactiplantibacillus argentoratensis]|uniref:glycosyltransferase n=1 Tax=Lactiplantibacillus argentoratensis TaxID=271881 RepID=UPI003D288F2F
MVILHFAEYASGGVATYLKDLIAAQSSRSDVEMVYLLVSEHNSDEELLKMDGDKIKVLAYSYRRSFMGIQRLLGLSKVIERLQPDIIHLHSSFPGLIRIKYLFSTTKNRIIYCSHGWSFNQEIRKYKKVGYELIEWILSHGCHKIINISKSEQKSAWFINPKKMKIIYNSISKKPEMNSEKSHSNDMIKLLFVGRLDRQKGIDLLMDSFDNLPDNSNVELDVIGDAIVDPIVDKFNAKKINFKGWKTKDEVRRAMQESDVLIVPSRWEGFGLVALEAMQVGTMVVASDAGALPEIVINNETGMIFKADSVKAITRTLSAVQNMTKMEIQAFGKRGQQRYQNRFNYSHMVDSVMNVYYEK